MKNLIFLLHFILFHKYFFPLPLYFSFLRGRYSNLVTISRRNSDREIWWRCSYLFQSSSQGNINIMVGLDWCRLKLNYISYTFVFPVNKRLIVAPDFFNPALKVLCMLQGYVWLKDKILSEDGRRQQSKLREAAVIADRIGCSITQLAIGEELSLNIKDDYVPLKQLLKSEYQNENYRWIFQGL